MPRSGAARRVFGRLTRCNRGCAHRSPRSRRRRHAAGRIVAGVDHRADRIGDVRQRPARRPLGQAIDRSRSAVASIGLSERWRCAKAWMRVGLSSWDHSARRAATMSRSRADLGAQLGDALGLHGRLELDLVDIGRGKHERDDDDEIDAGACQRPRSTSASDGRPGEAGQVRRSAPALGPLGGPQLGRARARIGGDFRFVGADRALGEDAEGRRRARTTSGRWREPPPAALREARKVLTMRSSSEWKATTTSRPPGLRTRSAAASPRCEFAQLVVHEQTQRLERAGGRMDVARP